MIVMIYKLRLDRMEAEFDFKKTKKLLFKTKYLVAAVVLFCLAHDLQAGEQIDELIESIVREVALVALNVPGRKRLVVTNEFVAVVVCAGSPAVCLEDHYFHYFHWLSTAVGHHNTKNRKKK